MTTTRGLSVELTALELREVRAAQRDESTPGPAARRARIIELLAAGQLQQDIAAATGAGIATVGRVRRRLLEEGVEDAIYGYQAPGAPRLLGESEEMRLVALACSEPPAGRRRWTIRLLAEEATARGLVERVGKETVRQVLARHGLKPWREKNVVRGRTDT